MQHKPAQLIFQRSFYMWSVYHRVQLLEVQIAVTLPVTLLRIITVLQTFCLKCSIFDWPWQPLRCQGICLSAGSSNVPGVGEAVLFQKIIIHWRVGFALLFIYGGKKSVLWAVFSRLKLWFTAFGLHPNNRTVRLTFSNVCAHKRTSLCDVTKGTNTSLIPPPKSPSHVCFFSFPSKHLFLQTAKT